MAMLRNSDFLRDTVVQLCIVTFLKKKYILEKEGKFIKTQQMNEKQKKVHNDMSQEVSETYKIHMALLQGDNCQKEEMPNS